MFIIVELGRVTRFERANDRFTAGCVGPLHHTRQCDNNNNYYELLCKEIFVLFEFILIDVFHPWEIWPDIVVESREFLHHK